MNAGENARLVSELKGLLAQQIKLARQDKLEDVEVLSGSIGFLMERIASSGVLGQAEFKGERERLAGLYGDLRLILAARRADVIQELSRIRRGRKAIKGYSDNI